MADATCKCQTQQKKENSASTQGTRLVDFLAILCVLIVTRLAFDVLLLLVKGDCLLTSIASLRKNANVRSSSGAK